GRRGRGGACRSTPGPPPPPGPPGPRPRPGGATAAPLSPFPPAEPRRDQRADRLRGERLRKHRILYARQELLELGREHAAGDKDDAVAQPRVGDGDRLEHGPPPPLRHHHPPETP